MSSGGGFLQTCMQNEEFKFKKRFTVFKTINRFPKIKKAFTVKLKIISVNLFSVAPNTEKYKQKKYFTHKQTDHKNIMGYEFLPISSFLIKKEKNNKYKNQCQQSRLF